MTALRIDTVRGLSHDLPRLPPSAERAHGSCRRIGAKASPTARRFGKTR